jgi:hypothetical protein
MCVCLTWSRDFSEMAALPNIKPSAHHPHCPHYKLIKFRRLIIEDRIRIIDYPDKIDKITPTDPAIYKVEDVFLTIDQFESLPAYEP